MGNSTTSKTAAKTSKARKKPRKADQAKPKKPYPDYPLTIEGNGQLSKRIRGQKRYFGSWRTEGGTAEELHAAFEAAVQTYLDERDDLHAGRTPSSRTDAPTVNELVNSFLASFRQQVKAGDRSERMYRDYEQLGEKLIAHLGRNTATHDLSPSDFAAFDTELAMTIGATRRKNMLVWMKSILRWGYDQRPRLCPHVDDLCPKSTVKGPDKKKLKAECKAAAKKIIQPAAIHRLLEIACPTMKACILLAVNAGLGNTDCSTLQTDEISGDWLETVRSKTDIDRRAYLWPETRKAIQDAIAQRPAPANKSLANNVFLRPDGDELTKMNDDWIGNQFKRLMKAADVRGGFYALRHSCRTAASNSRDVEATRVVMGHKQEGIDAHYIAEISDDRLRAVADAIHKWLFDEQKWVKKG